VVCGSEGAWACAACAPKPATESWQLVDGLEARSLFSFEDAAVRELLHYLKYNGVHEAADLLVGRADLSVLDLPVGAILVPVPISFRRRKERGYNQAELLAGALSRRLGLRAWHGLVRTHAATLVGQGGAARRSQEQRFVWNGCEAPMGHLVIVDDICTTGSTLRQCVEALQPYAKGDVLALAAARVSAAGLPTLRP